jgi:hypothetical protein
MFSNLLDSHIDHTKIVKYKNNKNCDINLLHIENTNSMFIYDDNINKYINLNNFVKQTVKTQKQLKMLHLKLQYSIFGFRILHNIKMLCNVFAR